MEVSRTKASQSIGAATCTARRLRRFGNFYGLTVYGGTPDDGRIYKFTP
jgi:hypothetical protein